MSMIMMMMMIIVATSLMAAADIETRTGLQVEVAMQTNMENQVKVVGVDMMTTGDRVENPRRRHLLLSQNDLGLQVIQAGDIRVRLGKTTLLSMTARTAVIEVPGLALQLPLESEAGSWEKWMEMIEFLWSFGFWGIRGIRRGMAWRVQGCHLLHSCVRIGAWLSSGQDLDQTSATFRGTSCTYSLGRWL